MHFVEIELRMNDMSCILSRSNLVSSHCCGNVRLDFKAIGLWQCKFSKTYLDGKIFNLRYKVVMESIANILNLQRRAKKLLIDTEKATLFAFLFECTTGVDSSVSRVLKQLVSKLCKTSKRARLSMWSAWEPKSAIFKDNKKAQNFVTSIRAHV